MGSGEEAYSRLQSPIGKAMAARFLLRTLSIAALATGAVAAPPLPMAGSPEEVGLSSRQLARIEEVTRKNVEAGIPPGAVMIVARKGKIAWYQSIGHRDRDAGEAMRSDSIFRIYSMTKPVVSVAVMMLAEEGKLLVGDPVSKYLPELAGMKVGVEKIDASGKPLLELVAPQREMTIQDLLRHTSGLIYPGTGDSAVTRAWNAGGLLVRDADNREFVSRLAKLPLRFSPGTRWEYGVSVDVLGRVLEVIEKKSLGEILEERIFRPLGMVDTAFFIPPGKMSRAAQPWQRPGARDAPRFDVSEKPAYEAGGHGLVGTTEDYLRFALMLANGGELDGKRIVTRKTIELMTADHVGDLLGRPGMGFGLGFEVRTAIGGPGYPGSVGEYGWAGVAGTLFWIDPKEQLIAIYMVQVADAERARLRTQFRTMVQAAILK
jgi:CubicO group peptidase (beta-lactamase class C family)